MAEIHRNQHNACIIDRELVSTDLRSLASNFFTTCVRAANWTTAANPGFKRQNYPRPAFPHAEDFMSVLDVSKLLNLSIFLGCGYGT